MTEDNKKQAELPETSPGLEPPIKESSEQRGMAPRPDEKEKLVPIGKSGLSAGKPDRYGRREQNPVPVVPCEADTRPVKIERRAS
jgi:hypothetical protein